MRGRSLCSRPVCRLLADHRDGVACLLYKSHSQDMRVSVTWVSRYLAPSMSSNEGEDWLRQSRDMSSRPSMTAITDSDRSKENNLRVCLLRLDTLEL